MVANNCDARALPWLSTDCTQRLQYSSALELRKLAAIAERVMRRVQEVLLDRRQSGTPTQAHGCAVQETYQVAGEAGI